MRRLKRSECVVMPLVLTYKWYDMIDKGDKREEYRDATSWYETRFNNFMYAFQYEGKRYPVVAFQRAYTKPGMYWLCEVLFRSEGCKHPEWGEPESSHWVLHLLERIELEE